MSTAPCVVAVLDAPYAGEARTVQYAAYLAEARRYGTTEIPPLREGSEENLRLYRRAGYEPTGRLVDSAGADLLRLERLAPRG